MFAVSDDQILDSFVTRIDECSPNVFGRDNLRAVLAKLEHVAVFKHDDVFRVDDPNAPSPIPMPVELTMFAVNRHEELRSDGFNQYLQILLAPVTRHMNPRDAAVDDPGAALVAVRNQTRDRGLVARNLTRRKHYRVALIDKEILMLIGCELGHRGHRIALASRYQQHQFIVVHLPRFRRAHEEAVRNGQLTKTVRGFNVAQHASAQQRDATLILAREVEHDLDSVNRTGETTQNDSALRLVEDLFERRDDRAFRLRASGPFGIRRIGK